MVSTWSMLPIVLLLPVVVLGQEAASEPVPSQHQNVPHGGFGGPTVAYTQLLGTGALMTGGRGAWLAHHRFVVGGGGAGTPTCSLPLTAGDGTPYAAHFGYSGLWLEYIFLSQSPLHVSAGMILGPGWLTFGPPGSSLPLDAWGMRTALVVEPMASAELDVFSFLRISLGLSYRYVGGVRFDNRTLNLSGLAGTLTLKFGLF